MAKWDIYAKANPADFNILNPNLYRHSGKR